jgi:hypothetical protein
LPGEPDFTSPVGALEGLSAIETPTPAVTRMAIPIPEDIFAPAVRKSVPIPADIFGAFGAVPPPEDELPLVETRPRTQGLVRKQVPFSELQYEAIDEGSAEELQKQPPPAPLPPGTIPKTPQDMADFAAQQSAARLAMLEEQMPKLDEMARFEADQMARGLTQQPTVSPEVPTGVNLDDYVGRWASYQDALMANQALAKAMPDYQVQDVTQETSADGEVSYIVNTPKIKSKVTEGIPEGLKIKAGKKDAEGNITYDLEPTPEVKQQIAAIKKPLETTETMLRAIGDIRKIYEGASPATGFWGSVMQWIPASDAADVRKLVKTLQGNIAFKTLADMRAASPTGGALGAVTERELDMLASAMGSIDPGLSHFLFKGNIDEIERILNLYKQEANTAISQIETPQKFQPIQSQENRVEIKSQEDYKKLKSGQKYIFNGVTGTKK